MTNKALSPHAYLIIGSGRMARHLQHYLQLLNEPAQRPLHPTSDQISDQTSYNTDSYNIDQWDRSQDPVAIQNKILKASHIYLAISDSAIEGFYRQKLAGLDKTVVHFSGALHIEGCIGAHPLMTFGQDLYDLAFYRQIFFTVCGANSLAEALPMLPNAYSLITAEEKAFYHAMCVVGGNFTTLLAKKMSLEMQKWNVPPEACALYLERALDNAIKKPEHAFTGPIARKDFLTVQKNLESLETDPYKKIYQAFLDMLWPDYPKRTQV